MLILYRVAQGRAWIQPDQTTIRKPTTSIDFRDTPTSSRATQRKSRGLSSFCKTDDPEEEDYTLYLKDIDIELNLTTPVPAAAKLDDTVRTSQTWRSQSHDSVYHWS